MPRTVLRLLLLSLVLQLAACTVTALKPEIRDRLKSVSVDVQMPPKGVIVVAPSGGALLLLGGPLLQGIVNARTGLPEAYLEVLEKNKIDIREMFSSKASQFLQARGIVVSSGARSADAVLRINIDQFGLAETGGGFALLSSKRAPYFNVVFLLLDQQGREIWGRRLVSQLDVKVPMDGMEVQDYFLQPAQLEALSRKVVDTMVDQAFADWK